MAEYMKLIFNDKDLDVNFEHDFDIITQKLRDKEYVVGDIEHENNPNDFDTVEKFELMINGYGHEKDTDIELFKVEFKKSVYKTRLADTFSVQVNYPDLSDLENKSGYKRSIGILKTILNLIKHELDVDESQMRIVS